VNEIELDEAKRKIEKGTVFLDVRTLQEFGFKHLANALSIPLYYIREAMKGMGKMWSTSLTARRGEGRLWRRLPLAFNLSCCIGRVSELEPTSSFSGIALQ